MSFFPEKPNSFGGQISIVASTAWMGLIFLAFPCQILAEWVGIHPAHLGVDCLGIAAAILFLLLSWRTKGGMSSKGPLIPERDKRPPVFQEIRLPGGETHLVVREDAYQAALRAVKVNRESSHVQQDR